MKAKPIRAMSIMAHQDDFEFEAGGLFALLRWRYGSRVKLKILNRTGAYCLSCALYRQDAPNHVSVSVV